MTVCQNCGRDMASRECADQAHRDVRGFPADALPYGSLWCMKCFQVKPRAKFWNGKTKTIYKTCNRCRYLARKRRPSKLAKQATWRAEKAAAEAFWSEQASTHT